MSKTTIADLPPHVYTQADLAKSLAEKHPQNTLDPPFVARTARYDTGKALLKGSYQYSPKLNASWCSFAPPLSPINPFISGNFHHLRTLLHKTLKQKKRRRKNKQSDPLHSLYDILEWTEKEMEAIHYQMAGSQKG